jgi:hypothetical protein
MLRVTLGAGVRIVRNEWAETQANAGTGYPYAIHGTQEIVLVPTLSENYFSVTRQDVSNIKSRCRILP